MTAESPRVVSDRHGPVEIVFFAELLSVIPPGHRHTGFRHCADADPDMGVDPSTLRRTILLSTSTVTGHLMPLDEAIYSTLVLPIGASTESKTEIRIMTTAHFRAR